MNWKEEWKLLAALVTGFLLVYFLPVGNSRFEKAVLEGLQLAHWYAREHVLFCLIPAFFIAGAIAVFIAEGAVMKYLGAKANKLIAYAVASVSGSILAVCSCTVLPLFAGIYRMGAGLGPATAFLYSGPAINVLAIVLTTRILGVQLGTARAIGAVVFAIVIGIAMDLLFHREEQERRAAQWTLPSASTPRPLWQTLLYFVSLMAVLIFATWSQPTGDSGLWNLIATLKWPATAAAAFALLVILVAWFGSSWRKAVVAGLVVAGAAVLRPDTPVLAFTLGILALSWLTSTGGDELERWFESSWSFAKQILPLLLAGVLVAGSLLGRPGGEGLVPSTWVQAAVGGNSLSANLFAAVAGSLMYFATLTEIPILQGLLANGMGQGPALALLLAGPALSLPNMLVIASVLGWKKTWAYVVLTVVFATLSGLLYGFLIG